MSKVINSFGAMKPYKSLVILLTQSGTDNPVLVDEEENTIGSYNLERIDAGYYRVKFLSDYLTENKTTCEMANNISLPFDGYPLIYTSINAVSLSEISIKIGGAWNDVLNNQISVVRMDSVLATPTKIEIRVYE